MNNIISEAINANKAALKILEGNSQAIKDIASLMISAFQKGGKVLFCGNGGSAADAQHLAAELVGRFKKNRDPLPSVALSVNTSILTAVGNDFGFDEIFSRQVQALASSNDVLVGISTSGDSKNIIKAIKKAKELGLKVVAFLGKDGGQIADLVNTKLLISCSDTPRIQEMHILAGHIICEIVEDHFVDNK